MRFGYAFQNLTLDAVNGRDVDILVEGTEQAVLPLLHLGAASGRVAG